MPATSRVLLIADNLKWAWGHVCHGIQKYAPPDYDVEVTDHKGFGVLRAPNSPIPLRWADAVVQSSWYEAVFPTSTNQLPIRRNVALVGSHGIEFPYPIRRETPWQAKIATSIRNSQNAEARLSRFDKVICVNRDLERIAKRLGANAVYCPPGVDHELFCPGDQEPHKTLRIGWAGQTNGQTKGYMEVLRPLQERLGDAVDWWVNRKSPDNPTPHMLMPLWYRDIDVFLSTSFSEGSQNPPLEAMACGKPVIMTRCGTAEEIVEDGKTGWLVDCYSNVEEAEKVVDQIVEKIRDISPKSVHRRMGDAARQRVIGKFSWAKSAPIWLREITDAV